MPAISRPLLIALIVAIAVAVAYYATQRGGESGDASAPAEQAAPQIADAGDVGSAPAAAPAGVPPALRSALRRRQTVVLLLFKPGSADDAAVVRAVDALRGRSGVAVFTDPIGRIGRYRGLIRDLPVTQPPAVVIVDRRRRARVIQGYVDPATLAQDLADAR